MELHGKTPAAEISFHALTSAGGADAFQALRLPAVFDQALPL